MFAIAHTYGQHPALNVVSGWIAWEYFCKTIKEGRCVSVVAVDNCDMRCHYNASEKEIVFGY